MTAKDALAVKHAYLLFLQDARGRLVLEDLRASFYDRLSHNTNDPNPLNTAFREGERHVVAEILWTLEALEKGED